MSYLVQNPILFLIFNRIETTKKVFESIAKVKPKRLYIAGDSARNHAESQKVTECRDFVLQNITWECEVKTRFLEQHLGCKHSLSSAILWFFSHEKQGIILEDDDVGNESFYRFCDEMLEIYKDAPQISMVSGWSALDFAPKAKESLKESYYFSKYNHIWGFASWARAWEKYELENANFECDFAKLTFDSKAEQKYWHKTFKSYYAGEIDTWDYPMSFCNWQNEMLCIYPKHNLIQNIGLNRADAAHTTGESKFENMRVEEMPFPLTHPCEIKRNVEMDKANFKAVFAPPNILVRVINKLSRMIFGRNAIKVS
ncbi:methyltransferase FkbM [Helicobacter sp. 23-1044]